MTWTSRKLDRMPGLVVGLGVGQRAQIGDVIVRVDRVSNKYVHIRIDAPKDVPITRLDSAQPSGGDS